MEALAGSLLGILLGMRHACEPDHLAALSTLAVERRSAREGVLLGAFWGLGHTCALFAVAVSLALLHAVLPARLEDLFELGVAFMLLSLGVRALIRAAREGPAGPSIAHAHGPDLHRHQAGGSHLHLGRWTLAVRPLLVGIVHGLAGSGALTALALATMPGRSAQLWYVALFGLGSVAGMGLLSGLAGWPLARLGRRPVAVRALAGATGLLSVVLGIAWGWPRVVHLSQFH